MEQTRASRPMGSMRWWWGKQPEGVCRPGERSRTWRGASAVLSLLLVCMAGLSAPVARTQAQSVERGAGAPPRGQVLATASESASKDAEDVGPLPLGIQPGSVGTLAGAVTVGASGGVGWSTALKVVPGVGGVEPALSIGYGGAGYGGLGVGFSLSAGGELARCRQTRGQDGRNGPITWTQSDALCLDGVRLVAVQGMHGADKTEYRLQTGHTVRVVAAGASTAELSGFAVYTPDGRVTHYGAVPGVAWTQEALQWAQLEGKKIPFSWHVSQVIDTRTHNQMAYRYAGEAMAGDGQMTPQDHRLTGLWYGINGQAGTDATRRVEFRYRPVQEVLDDNQPGEEKAWVHQGYVAGMAYTRWQVLERVTMWVKPEAAEWAAVRYYQLGYERVPEPDPVPLTWAEPAYQGQTAEKPISDKLSTSDRVRLGALQECMSEFSCFWPTQFAWSTPAQELVPMAGFGWSGASFYPLPPIAEQETTAYSRVGMRVDADVDGDGDEDILVMTERMNSNTLPYISWALWRTDPDVHGPVGTNIPAWSTQPWTNRAGTVMPDDGTAVGTDVNIGTWQDPVWVRKPRPPETEQTGHLRDKNATPGAWAVNYDGTGGTDVLIADPVRELAGALGDSPNGLGWKTGKTRRYGTESNNAADSICTTYVPDLVKPAYCYSDIDQSEADYSGHPGFMAGLNVWRLTPAVGPVGSAQFERTSLNYPGDRPIFWLATGDLDGNGLTDLMFCRADADYAAVAGKPLPMYYADGTPATNWVSGTLRYAMNQPGTGLSLGGGGAPVTQGTTGTPVPCHAKDSYLMVDLHGDGRMSLLHRAHPHAGKTTIAQIAQSVPAGDVEDPYPMDQNDSGLTGYWHKMQEKVWADHELGQSYYHALTYSEGVGVQLAPTNLPFEQFMAWQRPGNLQGRYSTHQAAKASDADGGFALDLPWGDTRDGRLTDWGSPDSPMVGGGSNLRLGDINGDGLTDVLMVDLDDCRYGQLGATQEDPPQFHTRPCSFQDAAEFGRELIEQTYEKLAVFVYLNRGDGSFALGSKLRLWDTDLTLQEQQLLEKQYVEGLDPGDYDALYRSAWTAATQATRNWRMEFEGSLIGDGNSDGLADLGYIRNVFEPDGGWDGDSMSGRYRLYAVWRFGRQGGGLSNAETRMGLDLHKLVPDDVPTGWPGWQRDLHNNRAEWRDANGSAATVSPYEQHLNGLGARLMQLDVNHDGRPETAFYDHVRGQWLLATPVKTEQPQPHLLTAVVDGLGARTEVDYAPQWTLTDPATPWSQADIDLPYPYWQRPSTAAAAMVLRRDSGQDDGDAPRYVSTQYLYGKTLIDVDRGINLGIERSTAEQSVLTPAGAVNSRQTTRYDVAPTYNAAFKAYPLAGSVLSTATMAWGTADATVAVSHSGQRYSAHAGLKAGTWWRRQDAGTAATYEVGGDVPATAAAALMACLVGSTDAVADCSLGPQPSYQPLTHSTTALGYDPDGYGLVRSQVVESAGSTSATETSYTHHDPLQLGGIEPYVLGLPTVQWVAHEPTPDAGFTLRTTASEYFFNGLMQSTTVEPDRPEYRSTIAFTYDGFGHVKTQTLTADGIEPATTTYDYSASGAYQTGVTNALGHTATTRWFEGCGLPEQQTNALGQTVVSDIDDACRARSAQTFYGDVPLTRKTLIHYAEWQPDANEAYPDREVVVTTEVEDGAKSYTIANRVGQVEVGQAPGFGFEVYTRTRYDLLGRPFDVSLPTKVGEEPGGWTRTDYDGRGRVIALTKPDGTQQTTHYDRYITAVTNEIGATGESEVDALGQVLRVMPPPDPAHPEQDTAMCYRYGAFGTLTQARPCVPTVAKGPTTLTYDDYGRLLTSQDAQAGLRITRYDALGRVFESEDALGQITRQRYDVLGRLIERTQAFGTPQAKTATWTYDTIAPGVLTQAVNAEGSVIEEPLLDQYLRPEGSRTTIHGRSFEQHQTYDDWGRVVSQTYPSLSLLAPVTTQTQYNGLDQPIAQLWKGQLLWEPVTMDAWGHLTEQRYGDGVLSAHATYDPITGRLQDARTDRHIDVDNQPQVYTLEHFAYDWYDTGLLRMRTQKALVQNQTDQADQFHYTPRGELAGWSTLGKNGAVQQAKMDYDGFGNILESESGHYVYEDEKLVSIDGPLGELKYTYTPNGNGQVETRTHAGGETRLRYDALGRVERIEAIGSDQRITYGPNGNKAYTFDRITGRETYYLGAYQEERGGELTAKGAVIGRYAFGPAHLTRTWSEADLSYSDTLSYTPPADHLGSTTLVTDATGAIVDQRRYDTWGNERDAADWTAFKAAPKDDVSGPATGYTGHHERKQFGATAPGIGGLIDMHTRYYDPTAKQFLQPDSIVPDVYNPISWNRRTYVDNSPTAFSDPTGMAPTNADGSTRVDAEGHVARGDDGLKNEGATDGFGNGGPANAPTGIGSALAGTITGGALYSLRALVKIRNAGEEYGAEFLARQVLLAQQDPAPLLAALERGEAEAEQRLIEWNRANDFLRFVTGTHANRSLTDSAFKDSTLKTYVRQTTNNQASTEAAAGREVVAGGDVWAKKLSQGDVFFLKTLFGDGIPYALMELKSYDGAESAKKGVAVNFRAGEENPTIQVENMQDRQNGKGLRRSQSLVFAGSAALHVLNSGMPRPVSLDFGSFGGPKAVGIFPMNAALRKYDKIMSPYIERTVDRVGGNQYGFGAMLYDPIRGTLKHDNR